MSILINLLPDVHQAKAEEHKRKQLATGIAILVWIICAVVVVLLALYSAGQKVIIRNTTKSIASDKQQLQSIPGLLDALTAEYRLESLPGLYGQRVYMTKFFQAYSEADPTTITIGSLAVDTQGVLTVSGAGANYAAVAKLARAMAASNVTVGNGAALANSPYFTNVTIGSLSSTSTTKGVNFTLTATMAPEVTNGSK